MSHDDLVRIRTQDEANALVPGARIYIDSAVDDLITIPVVCQLVHVVGESRVYLHQADVVVVAGTAHVRGYADGTYQVGDTATLECFGEGTVFASHNCLISAHDQVQVHGRDQVRAVLRDTSRGDFIDACLVWGYDAATSTLEGESRGVMYNETVTYLKGNSAGVGSDSATLVLEDHAQGTLWDTAYGYARGAVSGEPCRLEAYGQSEVALRGNSIAWLRDDAHGTAFDTAIVYGYAGNVELHDNATVLPDTDAVTHDEPLGAPYEEPETTTSDRGAIEPVMVEPENSRGVFDIFKAAAATNTNIAPINPDAVAVVAAPPQPRAQVAAPSAAGFDSRGANPDISGFPFQTRGLTFTQFSRA